MEYSFMRYADTAEMEQHVNSRDHCRDRFHMYGYGIRRLILDFPSQYFYKLPYESLHGAIQFAISACRRIPLASFTSAQNQEQLKYLAST